LRSLRVFPTAVLAAAVLSSSTAALDSVWARRAAFSGHWAATSSEISEWPQAEFGFSSLAGPLSSSAYLVPGLAVSGGGSRNLTAARAFFDLRYMMPLGERIIPYMEGGVTGAAFRVDVLDHTGDGPSPTVDRKTYLRGGFEFGAGADLALGGSWSVSAAIRRVWLGDIDTDLVRSDGRKIYRDRDPSFWELPRISIVYWF
jgi:hypothetical protein